MTCHRGAHLHGIYTLSTLPRWMVRNAVINVGRVWNLPCCEQERHSLINNRKIRVNPVPSHKPIEWGNEIV